MRLDRLALRFKSTKFHFNTEICNECVQYYNSCSKQLFSHITLQTVM